MWQPSTDTNATPEWIQVKSQYVARPSGWQPSTADTTLSPVPIGHEQNFPPRRSPADDEPGDAGGVAGGSSTGDPGWAGYFGEAIRPPRRSSIDAPPRHRPPPLHPSFVAATPQAPWFPTEPQPPGAVLAPSPTGAWYAASTPVHSVPLTAAPLWLSPTVYTTLRGAPPLAQSWMVPAPGTASVSWGPPPRLRVDVVR